MLRHNRLIQIALLLVAMASCARPVSVKHNVEHTDRPDSRFALIPGVLIPAGEFLMGDNSKGDHSPAHKVSIGSFYMDRYEVTNAQYQRFCEVTGHRLPEFWGMSEFHCGPQFPEHPVVGISWSDAKKYAEWRGMRLPTEAEWEYAARGGLVGKKFAHGDELDSTLANYWDWSAETHEGTRQVGSYPPNGFGLYDMTGNVLEWVSDRYGEDYYRESASENPEGPDKGRFRVIRGGGWHSGPGCVSVFYRNALPSNWQDMNVGFRCAREYP